MLRDIFLKAIPIFKKRGVIRASLFGSAARNKIKKSSDIDFLIEPSKGTTLFDLVGIKIDLENSLGREIDLVTYNSLSPLLRDKILKEQRVFYEKR